MRKSHHSLENQVFLEMLKACRIDRQLRQRDVASKIGCNQSMVSKVESGERRLDVIELRGWLMAVGVDFVCFAGDLNERLRTHALMWRSPFRSEAALPSNSKKSPKAPLRRAESPRRRRKGGD